MITTPPAGRRSAIDSAVTPVNVPISSTRVARVATTSASNRRVSTSPPAMPGEGIVDSVSALSFATAGEGSVVCAIAYSSASITT